jgi:hypothetical protein
MEKIRIPDPEWKKFGTGINIPDPQHCRIESRNLLSVVKFCRKKSESAKMSANICFFLKIQGKKKDFSLPLKALTDHLEGGSRVYSFDHYW